MKSVAVSIYILVGLMSSISFAAPREGGGNAKAVAKLQAMVRDITSDRDAMKTERDAIKSQLESDAKKFKAEIDKLNQEKFAAVSAESRLNSELTVQKSNNVAITGRFDKTNAKLLEVIEKYKQLNQDKNDLSSKHANLEDTQRQTETELQKCEVKNTKLFEATKTLLDSYEKKDVFDALLKSDPLLQFKTVEMESIVQEYEDKLRNGKYQLDKKVH